MMHTISVPESKPRKFQASSRRLDKLYIVIGPLYGTFV